MYLDTQSNSLKNININYHNIYYCYYSTFIKIYPLNIANIHTSTCCRWCKAKHTLTLVCHKYVMMLPFTSSIMNSRFSVQQKHRSSIPCIAIRVIMKEGGCLLNLTVESNNFDIVSYAFCNVVYITIQLYQIVIPFLIVYNIN